MIIKPSEAILYIKKLFLSGKSIKKILKKINKDIKKQEQENTQNNNTENDQGNDDTSLTLHRKNNNEDNKNIDSSKIVDSNIPNTNEDYNIQLAIQMSRASIFEENYAKIYAKLIYLEQLGFKPNDVIIKSSEAILHIKKLLLSGKSIKKILKKINEDIKKQEQENTQNNNVGNDPDDNDSDDEWEEIISDDDHIAPSSPAPIPDNFTMSPSIVENSQMPPTVTDSTTLDDVDFSHILIGSINNNHLCD